MTRLIASSKFVILAHRRLRFRFVCWVVNIKITNIRGVALIGLGGCPVITGISCVDRLGYSSLRFTGRNPQPPGQHTCPGSAAKLSRIRFRDQPSNQPMIERGHLLFELVKPLEEFLLLGAAQRFQRQRRKFSVAGFDSIERRDNLVLSRTHVRILSLRSDTLRKLSTSRER